MIPEVPAGTFIHAYMAQMAEQETATAYDFWSAVWLIGTALGPEVHIARPRAPVYLNWYIILAAEAATTRKSTAVGAAERVLRAIDDPPWVVNGPTTSEALIMGLAQHDPAQVALCVPEMVSLFGRQTYAASMPGLMTDLYDCRPKWTGGATVARGQVTLTNNYVSMLTASTPTWLLRAINPDIIEGGFTSRCIMVHEEQPKRAIAWPMEVDNEASLQRVGDHLQHLRQVSRGRPTIHVEAAGIARFAAWYAERKQPRDPYRRTFSGREDAHVLRLAGCLAVNAEAAAITADDVDAAIVCIGAAREQGGRVFERVGDTDRRLVEGIGRLRHTLIGSGLAGASRTKLTRAMQHFMRAEELTAALEVMHELGMVQRFEGVPTSLGTGGRRKTIWRATQLMLDDSMLDRVLGVLD